MLGLEPNILRLEIKPHQTTSGHALDINQGLKVTLWSTSLSFIYLLLFSHVVYRFGKKKESKAALQRKKTDMLSQEELHIMKDEIERY